MPWSPGSAPSYTDYTVSVLQRAISRPATSFGHRWSSLTRLWCPTTRMTIQCTRAIIIRGGIKKSALRLTKFSPTIVAIEVRPIPIDITGDSLITSRSMCCLCLCSSHNQNLDGDIDIRFYTSPLYIIVKNLGWKFFLWEILILKLIKDKKENALWLILVWDWNTFKPEIDETLLYITCCKKTPMFPLS